MTKNILMAATGMLALFPVAPAFAQTTTNVPVGVNVTVGSACVINSGGSGTLIRFPTVANPVAFPGNLDGSNLVADGGTPLSITCNASSNVATFQINAGLNDALTHRLASGASRVNYQVYSDAARSIGGLYRIGVAQFIRDNGVGPFGQFTANTPFSINLYGRILQADVNVATAGNYTDTLAGVLAF